MSAANGCIGGDAGTVEVVSSTVILIDCSGGTGGQQGGLGGTVNLTNVTLSHLLSWVYVGGGGGDQEPGGFNSPGTINLTYSPPDISSSDILGAGLL